MDTVKKNGKCQWGLCKKYFRWYHSVPFWESVFVPQPKQWQAWLPLSLWPVWPCLRWRSRRMIRQVKQPENAVATGWGKSRFNKIMTSMQWHHINTHLYTQILHQHQVQHFWWDLFSMFSACFSLPKEFRHDAEVFLVQKHSRRDEIGVVGVDYRRMRYVHSKIEPEWRRNKGKYLYISLLLLEYFGNQHPNFKFWGHGT